MREMREVSLCGDSSPAKLSAENVAAGPANCRRGRHRAGALSSHLVKTAAGVTRAACKKKCIQLRTAYGNRAGQ